jgi:hypothetical protein
MFDSGDSPKGAVRISRRPEHLLDMTIIEQNCAFPILWRARRAASRRLPCSDRVE